VLTNPKLRASSNAALRMIDVANSLALGKAEAVPRKLDELIELVSNQPENFRITWIFNGTLHFISQHERLAPHREWLNQLFAAAKAGERDAIVKALRDAKGTFKK
jgi:hypothetical protein